MDIDLWLIFCRESDMMADPSLALMVGHNVVWQSAFFFTKKGETIALVGNYDLPDFKRSGRFKTALPYVQDCGREIKKIIEKINPKTIALNFSQNDDAADGLTHGMYLLLLDYLKGTPFVKRFVSSEKLMSLLRGRKIEEEIMLVASAANLATKAWAKSLAEIKMGMSEIEIAQIIDANIKTLGAINSFRTIVNAGVKSDPGHGHPTAAILEPGDLLHVDFGARLNGYCSDIQRLAYFKRPEESISPPELTAAFNKVREIISETSKLYKPGAKGHRIDSIARTMLKESGYPVYQHALGHQIGRSVHDGAATIGPKWKRYGTTPEIPLEPGNLFTVELGIEIPLIGYVGLEEDLIVTKEGGKFLCPCQTELPII
ncbi:MAG: Xaa-Pro peptidase family protein [candidate division Zixibacteria bacterium]|nr:Xaa-Pro peptidase family protein [candidate division Zixibacteria bacterium]